MVRVCKKIFIYLYSDRPGISMYLDFNLEKFL